MSSHNPSGHIKEIVRTSLSDIIAGFILLIVSILVFLDMFNVLRNPAFNAAIGLMFLYLALSTMDLRRYHNSTEKVLNSDLNAIIVGLSLLVISMIGVLGHIEIIRTFTFPLVPGVLLMVVAISRIFMKAYSKKVKINRIDPCGIVGGELLIFYSVLLYLDFTALAWSPIFPIFVAAALYTALFVDVLAMARSNQSGINDATAWLDEIEDKISDVRSEFESIKLAHDDPQLSKSLERLVALQKRLVQLRAMTASQMTEIPSQEDLTELIDVPERGETKPAWTPVQQQRSGDNMGTIEAGDLKELIGHNSTDEIFYENLMKEFELAGMSDIIREAKEMRNSIVSQRKNEN